MGVCDSTNNKNRRNRHESNVKENKETASKNDSIAKTGTSSSNHSKQKEFILPEKFTIHSDIREKYSLATEFLGQGASGTVFEATDKEGKKYAIKSINKFALENVDDLVNEAEISINISHPHIIKYYELYEDLKTVSFVMDLVEGGDLYDFILKSPEGKLDDSVALELTIQILETLDYLHNEKGICHRDIKPENFLVQIEDSKPQIKLIDFGFATFINPDIPLTGYMGTPIYMAPEILSKEPYSEKIDLWAVGIILFNMLTGCQPFRTHSITPIEDQVINETIYLNGIENERLRNLCMNLLEKDALQRFSTKRALSYAYDIREKMNKM